jgi:hypothetical protein
MSALHFKLGGCKQQCQKNRFWQNGRFYLKDFRLILMGFLRKQPILSILFTKMRS